MDDEPRLLRSIDPPPPALGPLFPNDKWWVVQDWVLAGPYPGSTSNAVAERRLGDLLDLGVTCFIDLTEEVWEPGSRPRPYSALLKELTEARGGRASHLRFPFGGLPEVWLIRTILHVIRDLIADGQMIYLHDGGRLAQTGVVVGCLAFETGVPLNQITRQIRRLRSQAGTSESTSLSIESTTEFIRNWPSEFEPIFTPDGPDGPGSALTTLNSLPQPVVDRTLSMLRSGDAVTVEGPMSGWCIQAIGYEDHVYVEVLDPSHWGTGPDLTTDQKSAIEELGLEHTGSLWRCNVSATDDEPAAERGMALIELIGDRLWGTRAPAEESDDFVEEEDEDDDFVDDEDEDENEDDEF